MEATTVFTIGRRNVVPEGESRVAWLEKYGVVPAEFKVPVSADLQDWAQAGVSIGDDGSISDAYLPCRSELAAALTAKLREDPSDLSGYDASDLLRDFAAKKAAKATAEERIANALNALSLDDVMDSGGRRCLKPHVLEDAELVHHITQSKRIPYDARSPLETALLRFQKEGCRRIEAASEREAAAAKARCADARQARIAGLARWVAENGEKLELDPILIRAASEGRDVTKTVHIQALCRICDVLEAVAPGSVVHAVTHDVSQLAPTARAYATRDAIVAHIAEIRKAAIVPDPTVTISDFLLLDVAPVGKQALRDGIRVAVSHPWLGKDVEAEVLTEPLNYSDEQDKNQYDE